ncbi:hypothetical protein F503_08300 [Ophiostoma piceae UAMH 11346]|uniref:Uncharacterized protein n=1 Tax=Ophiostoma piceae (strain UAMH 11346) TaxID=1262450 RepID=S3BX10_OPHP1|nr:hypothetical protein F503_08300 [Ophiostoma piceae UAMH 11346]
MFYFLKRHELASAMLQCDILCLRYIRLAVYLSLGRPNGQATGSGGAVTLLALPLVNVAEAANIAWAVTGTFPRQTKQMPTAPSLLRDQGQATVTLVPAMRSAGRTAGSTGHRNERRHEASRTPVLLIDGACRGLASRLSTRVNVRRNLGTEAAIAASGTGVKTGANRLVTLVPG